ncbi:MULTISPECIES: hypothetical protein [unclassified Amycolatopsis]|uniref:hypothetical protein n=1 Tax=unclassified Amycolatopsis TaxID=2618356 RepID=UPI001C6A2277|nr:hypothetical protein [Amycolatopsis sp. DSM 110486]QYN19904.1 hypothetical protein K1T34_46260 [Amycolatopsis sp. DSM 110486]
MDTPTGTAVGAAPGRVELFGNQPGQQIEYSAYLPDFGGWQQSGKNRQEAGTTWPSEPITALWVSLP